MTANIQCLVNTLQNCVNGNTTPTEISQISGVFSTLEDVYSVANTSMLPSATDNTGRMIFVEDICAYRYSDGFQWTNCYDTTSRIEKYEYYEWGCGTWGITDSLKPGSLCKAECPSLYEDSNNWLNINSGYQSTSIVKTDGTLWSWGENTYGQLGDATSQSRSSPVQEKTSSTNWCSTQKGLTRSRYHTNAIKTDGTLWGWGTNSWGQIADNTTTGRQTPTQEITSSTNWCNVSAGFCGSVALKTDGTFWVMGQFGCGASGTNVPTSCYSSPVQEISSSTDWCDSFAACSGAGGIKTDGTMWGMGRYDVVNDGTFCLSGSSCASSPVQEAMLATNWCYVASHDFGSGHAIKLDGTLWTWGCSLCGRRGVNNTTSYVPGCMTQEYTSSTNWCLSRGHAVSTVALKTDGTLWGWGKGGLTGDGTFVDRSSPVQELTSSTDWFLVSPQVLVSMGLKVICKGF